MPQDVVIRAEPPKRPPVSIATEGSVRSDPFLDPSFHALKAADQVAIIGHIDPSIQQEGFVELPPDDQLALLGLRYPGFKEWRPKKQTQFLQQLKGRGAIQVPTSDTPFAELGDSGPSLIDPLTDIGRGILHALKTPQEYMWGAITGKSGERRTTQDATGLNPDWLVPAATSENTYGTALNPEAAGLLGVDLLSDPMTYVGIGIPATLARRFGLFSRPAYRDVAHSIESQGPLIPPELQQPGSQYQGPPVPQGLQAPESPYYGPTQPGAIPAQGGWLPPTDTRSMLDLAEQARAAMYAPGPSTIVPQHTGVRGPQYTLGGPTEFIKQPESVKGVGAGFPSQQTIPPGTTSAVPPSITPTYQPKPGFLQTAEERIRANAPIPTAEDLLKRRFEREAGMTVDELLRPEAAAARRTDYERMLKERTITPPPTTPVPPSAARVNAEFEAGKSPGADVTKGASFRVGEGNTIEQEPGWFARGFRPALEVLSGTGPKGKELSNLLWNYLDKVERDTSHIIMNVDAEWARIWGRRSYGEQRVHRGFNAWKSYTMDDLYNMSKDDVNQLVDYLYTGGRIVPTGPNAAKIKETAKVFFEKGTRLVSGHEGVLQLPGRMLPSGEFEAFGPLSMFFPQQPLGHARRNMLQDRHLRDLFHAAVGKHGYTGSFNDYKDLITRWIGGQNEIESARFAGIENARLFHADDLGKPSEVLLRYGFETDPARALFRYVSGGLRRGDGKLIEKQANELVNQIEGSIQAGSGQEASRYVRTVAQRVLGVEPLEVAEKYFSGWVSEVLATNDATLLQLAGLDQFNQMAQVVGRGGMVDTAKGIVKFWREGGSSGLPSESGAMFTRFLNELVVPRTVMGRVATGALRATGFTAADDWVRAIGAMVGSEHSQKIAKQFIQKPTDPKLRGILEALRVDPDELLKVGRLTPEMEERAAQTFANLTSGKTDVRTLPLWLTSSDPTMRLIGQYKKFMFNNAGEMIRQAKTYGPWAVGRSAGAAIGLGEITRDAHYFLTHLETPGLPLPGETEEKRIAKPIRPLHKYSPLAARAIDDLVFGLGSVFFLLGYSALEGDALRLVETVAPALGLAEPLAHVGTVYEKAAAGKEHPTKPLVRDVLRRVPVVGSVGYQMADVLMPRSSRAIRPLDRLKPLTPFGDEP